MFHMELKRKPPEFRAPFKGALETRSPFRKATRAKKAELLKSDGQIVRHID